MSNAFRLAVLNCLFLALPVLANSAVVDLTCGKVNLSNASLQSLAAPANSPTESGLRPYLMVPGKQLMEEERQALGISGIKILGPIPTNAYVIAARAEKLPEIKKILPASLVGEYLPEYKLDFIYTGGNSFSQMGPEEKAYLLFGALDKSCLETVLEAVKGAGGSDAEITCEGVEPSVKAHIAPAAARQLAKMAEIIFVEPYEEPKLETDIVKTRLLANLEDLFLKGYNGAGTMICIQDTGLDNGDRDNLHPDFKNKKLIGRATAGVARQRGTYDSWYDAGSHGTHVAGDALGDGTASKGQYRGMGYGADIFVLCAGSSSGGVLSGSYDDITNVYHCGARIMNCSFGSGRGGNYRSTARQDDLLQWQFKDFQICHSCGNYNDNDENPTSQLNDGAASKNTISAGAAESYRPSSGSEAYPADGVHQGMASFSSRGPAADGRMKPDIVIPGTAIMAALVSTNHSSVRKEYYRLAGGTSMASPLTAGCCATIRQYLMDNRGLKFVNASLIRAVLFAGTRTLFPGQYTAFAEIPNFRPNYVEGHGHVNIKESLEPTGGKMEFFEAELASNGQAITNIFSKLENVDLTVSLAWTDYPAASGASKSLINDLDLTVIGPKGDSYTLDDHLANSEVLRLGGVEAGTYLAIVKARNIMQGPQDFSLVVNQGLCQKSGALAFVREPAFKFGQNFCDILLTNLDQNCLVNFETVLDENSENVFSLNVTTGTFKKSASIRLAADLSKTQSEFPACLIGIKSQSGLLQRRIGLPNGNDKQGYALFSADYENSPIVSATGYEAAAENGGAVQEKVAFIDPELTGQKLFLDFEDYPVDESIIGQKGWTLGYGKDTNGTTMVRMEVNGGLTNKYLEIDDIDGYYAPHFKFSGFKNGWTATNVHAYVNMSMKVMLCGNGKKAISFYSPAVAETILKLYGDKYVINTPGKDSSHQEFNSQNRLDRDRWYDVSCMIEMTKGMTHHILREVVIDGVRQDCYGIYSESGAQDYFTTLRFFQWDTGKLLLDNFKLETYVSEQEAQQALHVEASGDQAKEGLLFNIDLPEKAGEKYDLYFDATLALDQDSMEAILGQDKASRQFQSGLIANGGLVSPYLTDYATSPTLITNALPAKEFFRYGYRLNLTGSDKTLLRVFFGDNTFNVDAPITSKEVAAHDNVKAMSFNLSKLGEGLKIQSLKICLLPKEKPLLFLAGHPFMAGSDSVTLVLTNSYPSGDISYTARIVKSSEEYSVTPPSGTFKNQQPLTVALKNPAHNPRLESLWLEVAAGPAGTNLVKINHPIGNLEDGYLLYEDDFDDALPGDIADWHLSFSHLTGESAVIMDDQDGQGPYLHIEKRFLTEDASTNQGLFCYIGLPEGLSTNLDLFFQGEIRFPSTIKGNFILTQDESHRQFQTQFAPYTSSGQKTIKATLTDYTRNSALIKDKAPTGQFVPFSYRLNLLPSNKTLKEISFNDEGHVEGYKIGGSKVSKSDGIDQFCFRLPSKDTSIDIRNIKITIGDAVPEPAAAVLLALIAFFLAKVRQIRS